MVARGDTDRLLASTHFSLQADTKSGLEKRLHRAAEAGHKLREKIGGEALTEAVQGEVHAVCI